MAAENVERRFIPADTLELRVVGEGGARKIRGHAAVFGSRSFDLGGFVEEIEPGFFRDVLDQDTLGLFNHDSNLVLGRTSSHTLRLSEDARGLAFEIDHPGTSTANDLERLIERGDVRGASFAFRVKPGGDEFRKLKDGTMLRVLKAGGAERLYDVGPVTSPAYANTDATVARRSLEARKEDDMDKEGGKVEVKETEPVIAGNQDMAGDHGPEARWDYSADGGERRALGDDETFASWSEKRGHERPKCSFGGYLRALAYGPRNEGEEHALSLSSRSQMIGQGTLGGFLVPEALAPAVIDPLRAEAAVLRAGARRVPVGPDTKFPIQTSDPEVGTHGEGQQVTETQITFGAWAPPLYTFSAIIKASREAMEDVAVLEDRVTSSFASAAGLKIDRIALYGGAALEPAGVKSFTNAQTVDLSGAALSASGKWDPVLDLRTAILTANGGEPTALIMHPREEGYYSKLKDGDGNPAVMPPALANVARFTTTQVSVTEGAGTSADMFLAPWNRMEILMRTDINVTPLRERYADTGEVGFWLWFRFGIMVDHEERFGYVTDIGPEA